MVINLVVTIHSNYIAKDMIYLLSRILSSAQVEELKIKYIERVVSKSIYEFSNAIKLVCFEN